MNRLVFREENYRHLRSALLASAPVESAAILLAGQAISPSGARLLIRDLSIVSEAEALVRAETRFVISPETLARWLKRARTENLSLVFAHSHPFDKYPRFSVVDDAGEREFMPAVFARASDRRHATLVIGVEGFDARALSSPIETAAIELIDEIGPDVRHYPRLHQGNASGLGPRDLERFDRNVRAFGQRGQEALRQLRVGIVGLGGTGSVVAEQLAYLGVGSLTLIDPETIEGSNTNRVIGSSGNVGRAKVESAADLVRRIRDDVKVNPIKGAVHVAPLARPILEVDFIFCCTDSQGSRAVLNQIAYQYLIPVIDVGVRIDAAQGSIERITGRVQMLSPGLPCLVCQDFLDPEEVRRDLLSDEERKKDQYIVGAAEPQPAVVSLNSTVSSLAVTMMLSAVTGVPVAARHQIYLAEQGMVRAITGAQRGDCIVCSMAGALARGDSWQLPWRLR
jgi:molybdopterin/thiamine biosynthesis adenylyltransferase